MKKMTKQQKNGVVGLFFTLILFIISIVLICTAKTARNELIGIVLIATAFICLIIFLIFVLIDTPDWEKNKKSKDILNHFDQSHDYPNYED